MPTGLDGLADSNPLWVRKWFYKIVCELIKRPTTLFESVPKLLKDAIFELEHDVCKSPNRIDKELKFTQRLKKHPNQYNEIVRAGVLGRLLGKDKGQEVFRYETKYKDNDTVGNFSVIVPTYENLNLDYYKSLLLNKLKDTLEIAGFDIKDVILETLPIRCYK